MKNLIIFSFVLFMALPAVFAQQTGVVKSGKSTYVLATDTATNTGDVWIGINYATGGYTELKNGDYLSIQPVATQLTGTTAGNIILQASIDGTNWVTLNSGNSDLKAANDTLVATNGANTLWNTTVVYPYYRVFYDGSGTHTSTLKATYYLVKKQL